MNVRDPTPTLTGNSSEHHTSRDSPLNSSLSGDWSSQSTLFFSLVYALHLPCLHLHGLAGPLLEIPSDRTTCRHQTFPFDLKVYRLLAYPFGLGQCLPLGSFDRSACRPMLLPLHSLLHSGVSGFRSTTRYE